MVATWKPWYKTIDHRRWTIASGAPLKNNSAAAFLEFKRVLSAEEPQMNFHRCPYLLLPIEKDVHLYSIHPDLDDINQYFLKKTPQLLFLRRTKDLSSIVYHLSSTISKRDFHK